ncbi:hypothetical protein GCM10009798_10400 [Nocardioides panacihumi]|uniref:HTH cro/C1-type domain-containing protein n=1 Tax=Nocardioides panacihumi TaxID=400774 RepID=A0ABP5BWB9_9ACTN
MDRPNLIRQVRLASSRTQAELAAASGTSQSTLSAYERGIKSPTLAVAERIIESAGYTLAPAPRVTFRQIQGMHGLRPFWLADRLWQLPPGLAFREVTLPWHVAHVAGSLHLHRRRDRAIAYGALLQRGSPEAMLDTIDGNLLVDILDDLDLPDPIHRAWLPFITGARVPLRRLHLD